MHTEPTGDGSIREVYDTKRCAGCQGILAYPRVKIGWQGCTCAGTAGHRTFYCLDCKTWNYDPPHVGTEPMVGGAGYFDC